MWNDMWSLFGTPERPGTLTTSGENRGTMLREPNHSESTDQETVEHQPSLTSEYEKQVRPLIDLIDNLRHFGLEQDVPLPSIVVVGDQSAGKSSVLEAISGIQLPRGSGIVTTCPLELRLKSCQPGKEWRAKIKFQDNPGKNVEHPNDIDHAVRNAQKALAGGGISETLISLEVEAPNIPDLTLIDLPGITRVAAEGQSSNIPKQIKALIQKYIRKEETVILAIVPANVDIVTTEALQMAKEVDPDGERTLGVVTKPDLVDPGTEEDVVDVVKNKTCKLRKGYTIVKCRGQQAVASGQSLMEAIDEENTFFQCHEQFCQLPKDLYGIKSLSAKLTGELVNHIKKSLPTLKDKVHNKQEEVRKDLHMLGPGLPETDEGKLSRLSEILIGFTDSLKNAAEGEYRGLEEHYWLFTSVREEYENFGKTAHGVVPRNIVAARNFKRCLEEKIQKCRGRELPYYMKYSVCEEEIQKLVSGFHDPAFECLGKVGQLVGKVFAGLAQEYLGSYPTLDSKIKVLVNELRQQFQSRCEEELTRLLKMEHNVFTQDSNYKMIKLQNKKEEETNAQKASNGEKTSEETSDSSDRGFSDGEVLGVKNPEDMCKMIRAYMEVCERRLIDAVPMNITYYMLTELVSEIRLQILQVTREVDAARLLEEESQIAKRRKSLKEKRERLEKAARELATF